MLLKKNIPLSYVIGKIKTELVLVIVYAVSFELIHHLANATSVNIPIAVPAILGTIISLLLAFKSNQAYDRWWEARIVWGAIVNDSRTLVRQVIVFYKDDNTDEAQQFRERFAKRQAAWCYALAQSLRGKDAIKPIKTLLSAEEYAFVQDFDHIPNALLMLHAKDLKKALNGSHVNSYQQVEIDSTLTKLCDAMGKCERIKNTVFPTTYTLYLRFTLCLFIILLPFGLKDYLGYLQIPVVAMIGAACFLIEKMALHLQDPFENRPTDTPMITISNTIEKNLMQMVNATREGFVSDTDVVIKELDTSNEDYFVL